MRSSRTSVEIIVPWSAFPRMLLNTKSPFAAGFRSPRSCFASPRIADRTEVEPGFFEAAGIEIVRGRNFNDADRPDTRPVVIVSVKRWPGVSGRTSTRSAGSSGGTTPISLGSSSVWRATRT